VCLCVCWCVCMCLHVCIHVCACVCVRMCVYICACLKLMSYQHAYTSICSCIHTSPDASPTCVGNLHVCIHMHNMRWNSARVRLYAPYALKICMCACIRTTCASHLHVCVYTHHMRWKSACGSGSGSGSGSGFIRCPLLYGVL